MPTPYLELLNCTSEAVKLRATPWWHLTSDYLCGEPTRETNEAGYLIRMEGTPQSELGESKTRGIYQKKFRSSPLPARGRLDLVKIGKFGCIGGGGGDTG